MWGTAWRGALANDAVRRSFLMDVVSAAGRGFVVASGTDFAAALGYRLDALGDLVEYPMDTGAVWRLLAAGAHEGLPGYPAG